MLFFLRGRFAMRLIARIVIVIPLFALYGCCCGGGGKTATESSDKHIVTPEEGYHLLKGCCEGAGGRYSPDYQDCIMYPGIVSAYEGCVGNNTYVKFPSGSTKKLKAKVRKQ